LSLSLSRPLNSRKTKKMRNQFLFSLSLLILLHCTTTTAQTPAQPPAPPGPTNITKILEKAGQFTTFIRLLGITQVGDQMNTQLNNSNQGLTIFAPTDNAFAGLKSGTLNSLTDEQKVQLVQFHVIPSFFTVSQFQTVSNPVRTQAGDNVVGEFPLNVTTSGNQVNVSSGLVDTTVGSAIYTDGQLAVYSVDKVLLPIKIFAPLPPAPAPAPTKAKKKLPVADTPTGNASVDASGAASLIMHGMVMVVSIGVTLIAPFFL
ncbi:unnamed protein product, partial [Ilex paraguariensis]